MQNLYKVEATMGEIENLEPEVKHLWECEFNVLLFCQWEICMRKFPQPAGLYGWKDPEGWLVGQAGGETTGKASHQEEGWSFLGRGLWEGHTVCFATTASLGLAQHLAPGSWT